MLEYDKSLDNGLKVCFFNRHIAEVNQAGPLTAFDTVHWDRRGQVLDLRDLLLSALPEDMLKGQDVEDNVEKQQEENVKREPDVKQESHTE